MASLGRKDGFSMMVLHDQEQATKIYCAIRSSVSDLEFSKRGLEDRPVADCWCPNSPMKPEDQRDEVVGYIIRAIAHYYQTPEEWLNEIILKRAEL